MIVAVVMVLQRIESLSHREAVERYAFDARWKYAAGGLDFDYPGFVHTVLVDMRPGWPARIGRTASSRSRWRQRRPLIVSILVGAASVWLAHRVIHEPVPTGHNAALSPFLTCVGLVYGALLGFTIVVAWEQFSSAEANVANEASTLTTMYRQTVGMPCRSRPRCAIWSANTRRRSRAPNGISKTMPAPPTPMPAPPTPHAPRSPTCTGCSAVHNPASRRARSVRSFSAS